MRAHPLGFTHQLIGIFCFAHSLARVLASSRALALARSRSRSVSLSLALSQGQLEGAPFGGGGLLSMPFCSAFARALTFQNVSCSHEWMDALAVVHILKSPRNSDVI